MTRRLLYGRLLHDRGEEGATLLLVIGFMLFVGLITAGLATQLASSSVLASRSTRPATGSTPPTAPSSTTSQPCAPP